MIRASLGDLIVAVADVIRFLGLIDKKSAAVKLVLEQGEQAPDATQKWAREVASFTAGRTYDYACAVILLYGSLERFIEGLVAEYLEDLSARCAQFGDLPKKLQTVHFELTLKHLSRTRDSRYSGTVKAPELAKSLSDCLNARTPCTLVAESLIYHSANFRSAVVDDYLGRVGIDAPCERALKLSELNDFQDQVRRAGGDPDQRPTSTWDLIDDLVERRNQIAHGDTRDALAPSKLLAYCYQVMTLAHALARVTRDSLVSHVVASSGMELGVPIAVFDNTIVCVNSKGVTLRLGSILACRSGSGEWRSLRVERVEIEGAEVESTPAGQDVQVGLRTDGRCKADWTIFSIE